MVISRCCAIIELASHLRTRKTQALVVFLEHSFLGGPVTQFISIIINQKQGALANGRFLGVQSDQEAGSDCLREREIYNSSSFSEMKTAV